MTGFYVLVEQNKDCHYGDVLLYNELQNLIVKLCQKVIKDLNLNSLYIKMKMRLLRYKHTER